MPGRKSKYTAELNGQLKMRVLSVLDNASDGVNPTLDWIRQQDMMLMPHTTQKLSRILGNLVDMGLVVKSKSKSLGKMVYRLKSKMEDDGYEPNYDAYFASTAKYHTDNWEVEEEQRIAAVEYAGEEEEE